MSHIFQDTQFHIPPVRPGAIERARLLARLDESLRPGVSLVLVSGPPGYGKTSLVSQWLHAHAGDISPAWIALGEGDDDPAVFLACLAHALREGLPVASYKACQAALSGAPGAPAASSRELVAMLLNGLVEAARPVVLILDDYQFVQAPAVHAIVADLLSGLPATAKLVITTRVDPPLGLARLRARNQLCEIRTADLQFSGQETASFLNDLMALQLSDADVAALAARTEGWAAGLQLAALSLQQRRGGPDRQRFISEFGGSHRFILEYLLDEVLDRQPPATQSFLLRTARLDRLCGELCDAVTQGTGGQAMLESLARSNLFVLPLDDEGRWYRYHHLFADLLRVRVKQSLDARQVLDLGRRAACWYEQRGYLAEAIQLVLSALDFTGAAELLERHVLTFYYRSEIQQVRRWLAALPAAFVRERPLFAAVYAAAIALSDPYPPTSLPAAEPWLQTAESVLAANAAQRNSDELARPFALMLRSYWARFRGDDSSVVIGLARRALAALPEETTIPVAEAELPWDSDEQAGAAGPAINFRRIRSALYTNLGFAYWDSGDEASAFDVWQQALRIGLACGDHFNASAVARTMARAFVWHGRLAEAAQLCREVLDQIAAHDALSDNQGGPGNLRMAPLRMAPFAGSIGVQLGEVLLEWNRLDEAERVLRDSLELAEWTVGYNIQTDGWLALSQLALARGDVDEALVCVGKAERVTASAARLAAPYRVYCWLAGGRADVREQVVQWVRGCVLSEPADMHSPDRDLAALRGSLALVRFTVAECEQGAGQGGSSLPVTLEQALVWIERQERALRAGRWDHWLIRLLVLKAMARGVQGDEAAALDALRQAAGLAAPAGYMRTFIAERAALHELLAQLKGDSQVPAHWLAQLLSAVIGPEQPPVAEPVRVAEAPAGSAAQAGLVEPLTPREIEVLRMICAGRSNQEIAAALYVSLNTVKKHTHSVFGKLGASNRAQAILRAQQLGLSG